MRETAVRLITSMILALAGIGCDSTSDSRVPSRPDTTTDSGPSDAIEPDSPITDSKHEDAADVSLPDAAKDQDSTDDAQPETASETSSDVIECSPPDGLGDLSCVCDRLNDGVWSSSSPLLIHSTVDLGASGWVTTELTEGGQEIIRDGNLGGSSVESEALAFDILARCEGAELLKSEGEVIYRDPGGKKTDVLIRVDQRKVGVSVTRAYHYPPSEPCTKTEAVALLNKKLGDIPLSAANASPADAWERSMLAIIAVDDQCAAEYAEAWTELDSSVRGNTIVSITTTNGTDDVIY